MTKLFSPSLTRRKEPPNSLATVMHVGTKTALVNFRGRSYTAQLVGEDWSVGQTGYFVECPRGKYWITREQGSWYANKLENWIKNGLRANATLEYFLRKCKKWSPHMVSDSNELLKAKEPKPTSTTGSNFGTMDAFNRLDTDGDGYISLAEWQATGGTEATFNVLDKDGDGKISAEEWGHVKVYPDGKIRIYSDMLGTNKTGGGEDPEEPGETEKWTDYIDDVPAPPAGFTIPSGANTWWGFMRWTYVFMGSGPSLTYVTQKKGGVVHEAVGHARIPAAYMPSELYFLDRPALGVFQKNSFQDGFVYDFVAGAAGTYEDKTTFDKIAFFGGSAYISDTDEWDSEWTLNMLSNARSSIQARNPIFVISQNGGPLKQIGITLALESGNYGKELSIGNICVISAPPSS